jgi:hypothetical protein
MDTNAHECCSDEWFAKRLRSPKTATSAGDTFCAAPVWAVVAEFRIWQ